VAAAGGRVYVAGGFTAGGATTNAFEAYDPATNRWQRLEPLLIGVNHPGMAATGGRLYVLGGYQGPGLGRPTAAVQVFDPATDRWSELPPMPTPRDHLAAGVIGGKIYAVGGRNRQSLTLDALEVYDPAARRWSRLPPIPTGRSGHAAAAVGECLYVFGGEGNRAAQGGVFAEVEAYNARTNAWKALSPMPAPRHGIMAAVWDGKIYLPGGADVQGLGAVNTSDVFDPPGC